MLNDALVIGIVLTLVFGALAFYLYNRVTLAERKMTLVEGILTDMRIMMDSAPMMMNPPSPPHYPQGGGMFEPSAEMLQAISGPIPLQKEDVDAPAGGEDDYQQTLEAALDSALATETAEGNFRTLKIDESSDTGSGVPFAPIQVTKLSPDLDSMTVKELQGLAKQKGITVPAGTRRKDLIELLRKANVAPLQGTPLAPLDGPEIPEQGETLETSL